MAGLRRLSVSPYPTATSTALLTAAYLVEGFQAGFWLIFDYLAFIVHVLAS
jgi:hypothetical protein